MYVDMICTCVYHRCTHTHNHPTHYLETDHTRNLCIGSPGWRWGFATLRTDDWEMLNKVTWSRYSNNNLFVTRAQMIEVCSISVSCSFSIGIGISISIIIMISSSSSSIISICVSPLLGLCTYRCL